MYCVDLGESFQMSLFLNFFSNEIAIQTSIYYLLAKIGVDTAENEPLKVSPKLLEAKSLTIT